MKLACALFLLVALQIQAQPAEPPELTRAKDAYRAAAERVMAPVNAAYLKELERMVIDFGKAGKIDEALAVRNEIARLTGMPLVAAHTPETARLRNCFVDRTFATEGGTVFTFNKDGTGTKTYNGGTKTLTWEIVKGEVVKTVDDKAHFFWFESKQKGEIADAIDGTRRRVTGRP